MRRRREQQAIGVVGCCRPLSHELCAARLPQKKPAWSCGAASSIDSLVRTGMLVALTREVSPAITRCELTHVSRVTIDVARAREQHAHYEEALTLAGCLVRRLPPLPEMPDSVFVEDTAVSLDEVGIIARPGARSRRLEVSSVANALESYRSVVFIDPPGTLDGGDVLRVGRTLYVGLSTRTNSAGADMLEQLVRPYGYAVERLRVDGCLHLKSAVTAVDETTVIANPDWVDVGAFSGYSVLEVGRGEPGAANVLRVGDVIICGAGFPRTQALLDSVGCHVLPVDLSELAKAEGAVTCCSIVLDVSRSAAVAA